MEVGIVAYVSKEYSDREEKDHTGITAGEEVDK